MLTLLDDMPAGVLGVQASGKLSAADYTDVLEPAIAAATADGGKLRVVLVFEGAFGGMEPGAVWQDLRTGVGAWHAWERIALVTDQKWMADGLRLFSWAVPGQARSFDLAERAAAVAWAAGA
jgi:SpoIIAA-like